MVRGVSSRSPPRAGPGPVARRVRPTKKGKGGPPLRRRLPPLRVRRRLPTRTWTRSLPCLAPPTATLSACRPWT
eukprot:13315203-Alexandrium_andersonii.AAC.1